MIHELTTLALVAVVLLQTLTFRSMSQRLRLLSDRLTHPNLIVGFVRVESEEDANRIGPVMVPPPGPDGRGVGFCTCLPTGGPAGGIRRMADCGIPAHREEA